MTSRRASRTALRFKIRILEIRPPVWRRIEVPGNFTFWDLHCAIESAFEWEDHRAHEFHPWPRGRYTGPPRYFEVIGSSDYDRDTTPDHYSWQVRLAKRFEKPRDRWLYTRLPEMGDFSNDWEHEVVFEGAEKRSPGISEPVCLGGRRAAPPRDCCGLRGYEELVRARSADEDPSERPLDPEFYEEYEDFDPDFFDRRAVFFSDPKRALEIWREYAGP